MKKLLTMFTTISVFNATTSLVVSCNINDYPYIINNAISNQAKKALDSIVLNSNEGEEPKISTLFNYDLNVWLKPNYVPEKDLLVTKIKDTDKKNIPEITGSTLRHSTQKTTLPKDSFKYMGQHLLTTKDIVNLPWKTVVEKYNPGGKGKDKPGWTDQEKNNLVKDLDDLAYYYLPNYNSNSTEANQPKWLFVDKLRYEYQDWYKKDSPRDWSLNPLDSNYSPDGEYDQGIFYFTIINNFINNVDFEYYTNLLSLWGRDKGINVDESITNVSITFTTWDPKKWTKHFVQGKPVISSNDNVFENLPILPLDEELGVKLVIADSYGNLHNYIIGKIVLPKELFF